MSLIRVIASMIIVGLGQLLKGEVFKAIGLFAIFWILCSSGIGVVLAVPLWIWQVIDAGK